MAVVEVERGTLVTIPAQFKNAAGVITDPTGITFVMIEPDKTVTTYVYPATIIKDSTGNYHVDWTTAKDGQHITYFEGTGAVQYTLRQDFYVKQRVF